MEKIRPFIDRFKKLKTELAWILFGQFLGFVGGFIGIKVLTNIMGPKGYGQLALGLTIAGLFNLFIYGPISNVVARFYSVYRERGTLGVYFAVLRRSHKVLAIALTILFLAAGGVGWVLAGREWGLLSGKYRVVITSLKKGAALRERLMQLGGRGEGGKCGLKLSARRVDTEAHT